MNPSRRTIGRTLLVWLLAMPLLAGGWIAVELPGHAKEAVEPTWSLLLPMSTPAAIVADSGLIAMALEWAKELAGNSPSPCLGALKANYPPASGPVVAASHSSGTLFWQHVRLQI